MPGKRERRPQSDDVVDIHIFVVPLELWIGKYRTAYNNAVLQSTSAGFIRVPAEHPLSKIRNSIKEQLESDVIAEEFVFLRSVGRCLAVVNKQQEEKLKAKHFLPPVAFSPELFLLPCTHGDVKVILSGVQNDVYITGQTVGQDERLYPEGFESSFMLSNDQSVYEGSRETSQGSVQTEELLSAESRSKEGSEYRSELPESKLTTEVSHHQDDSTMTEELDVHDGAVYHEKWKSVVDRSEMLGEMPRPVKKASMSDKLKVAKLFGRSQSALPSVQIIQPESLPTTPSDYYRITKPTPLPSGRVICSPNVQAVGGHVYTENDAARNIESSASRANQESREEATSEQESGGDEDHEMLRGNDKQDLSSTSFDDYATGPTNADSTDPHGEAFEYALEKEILQDQRIFRNGKDGESFSNDVDEVKENRGLYNEHIDVNAANETEDNDDHLIVASSRDNVSSNRDRRRKIELEKKRLEEKKRNIAEGANKMVQEMEDMLRKKKEEEEKRRQMEEEVKKMMITAQEEKKVEIERLKEEVRIAREEKLEVQRRRETIVKLAKELQAKTHTKITTDTNIWKKKYQAESTRTTELEEELNRLRTELDVQHRKLIGTLDGKSYTPVTKPQKSVRHIPPSQLGNQKIQLQRLHKEVEDLRQRVDETRVKLSAETKMRSVAHQELKELRNQALDKKINAALSSRRFQGPKTLNGNVTA